MSQDTHTNSPRYSSVRRLKSSGTSARLSLTGGWARRHALWLVPVAALLTLVVAGFWLRIKIEGVFQEQKRADLLTLLKADVTALLMWLESQEENARATAQVPEIRHGILELARLQQGGARNPREAAAERQSLNETMRDWLSSYDYVGFVVLDPEATILACDVEELVGQKSLEGYQRFVRSVVNHQSLVSPPFPSAAVMPDEWNGRSAGVPTMFTAAPIEVNDKLEAILALRIRPDKEFSDILNVAQVGLSGETYAFDDTGLLLSESRFEDQLKKVGLQVDTQKSRSVLAIELRDPGVDMVKGNRPAKVRRDQPLTLMAQDATSQAEHVLHPNVNTNVAGYRDYRGVEVVGAWTWLPKYGFGIATEIDKDEAYAPLKVLQTIFWTLFGLLGVAALSMIGLTIVAGRFQRRMREAEVAAGKLGQYALEGKIGAGGMGTVYRGRHAMLRRPTAIKLLEPSKANEMTIARFEREVQLTSQLNHPNTITVYDFGRTPEGVFYYAMEFLEGLSLQALVERYGPQPDGRVIPILLQVCGSLAEAHAAGLIHRDVKPANIMLTRRGGVADFAKLLDFGLVKDVDHRQMTMLTAADSLTGTPLYMPPEAMHVEFQPDARGDLYSLGAVAYFLLTGCPVFDVTGVLDIIRAHAETTPKRPSDRLGKPISAELERLILACLAKVPDQRPASAAALAEALTKAAPIEPWNANDAESWWNRYDQNAGAETMAADSVVSKTLTGTVAATIEFGLGNSK